MLLNVCGSPFNMPISYTQLAPKVTCSASNVHGLETDTNCQQVIRNSYYLGKGKRHKNLRRKGRKRLMKRKRERQIRKSIVENASVNEQKTLSHYIFSCSCFGNQVFK